MAAVIFFYADKSFDVVLKKRVKSESGSKNVDVGTDVSITYKVRDIDERGVDIEKEEDFKGLLLSWKKNKVEGKSFVDQFKEEIIKLENEGLEKLAAWAKGQTATTEMGSRKRKMTAKMKSMVEEESSACQNPNSVTTETKKLQAIEYFKKKRATQCIDHDAEKPKGQNEPSSAAETDIEETGAHAEKQTAHLQESSPTKVNVERQTTATETHLEKQTAGTHGERNFHEENQSYVSTYNYDEQTKTCTSTCTYPDNGNYNIGYTSTAEPTRSLLCHSTPVKRSNPFSNLRQLSPIRRSPRLMEKHATTSIQNTTGYVQNHDPATSYFSSNGVQLTYPDYDNYDMGMSTAEVLSQGLYTLNNPCTSSECSDKISRLEEENRRLRHDLEICKGENAKSISPLIRELRELLNKWENPNLQSKVNMSSYRQFITDVEQDTSTLEKTSEEIPPTNNSRLPLSMSKLTDTDDSHYFDANKFFQPAEGKVKLVEGQNLFIDSTKLAIIRRKCKRNESKTLKALIDYFFTPKFQATHSATGEKSQKPPLPDEIIGPIKDYIQQNFKTDQAVMNAIINRKCLDAKRSKK